MKALKTKLRFLANIIENSKCEKLLGIKIHGKLCFKTRVKDLCKRVSRKIYALARITPYMDFQKKIFF